MKKVAEEKIKPVVNSVPIPDDDGGGHVNQVVQPDEVEDNPPDEPEEDAPLLIGVPGDTPKVDTQPEPANDTVA